MAEHNWVRVYPGYYRSVLEWEIEKSDDGRWKIYTPEKNLLDIVKTLAEARAAS